METKPKTKIKKFWTTNPDLLQRNTNPLHQSILQSSITTTTQSDQPRFKQPTSNTTTQCTQPNNKNHTSTCTKPQLLPQYTTAFFFANQTPIKHWSAHTQAPSPNSHSSKHRSPTPTFHATTHLQYHILSQQTHKTPHKYYTHNHIHFSQQIFPCTPTIQTHNYAPRKYQQSVDQNHKD